MGFMPYIQFDSSIPPSYLPRCPGNFLLNLGGEPFQNKGIHAAGGMISNEWNALPELNSMDFFTAVAWRVKERLRWARRAATSQATKARARGYRNPQTFVCMIYLIA